MLDTEGVAAKIGVKDGATVRVYLKRTRARAAKGLPVRSQDLPLPDQQVGRSPAWHESTIDRWIASRPGRGRRPAEP
ncbi:MarR family transcriptional regulator [Streptomyces filamentosus]